MNETIYALATARGRAGVAVVRVSGPQTFSAVSQLTGELPAHGRSLRSIRSLIGETIDQALVLTFQSPDSFTGEDVVELHLHGSIAIVDRVLRELGALPGLRFAEAGEFSRRALENGKLDLAQIEGLADLIDAETEAQRLQAMRVFSGELGTLVDSWRARLLRAAALLEAMIDFADEDVPQDVTPEVVELMTAVRTELQVQSDGVAFAERVRAGFEVAIIGPPNAGKSSLLNRMAGRDAAITSQEPGTTRDVIEVYMDLGGFPVTLIDTAGLRDAESEVEKIGIERGGARAQQADLRLYLAEEEPTIDRKSVDFVVQTKIDQNPAWGDLVISSKTGAGIDALRDTIVQKLTSQVNKGSVALRARHRDAMGRAMVYLQSACELLECGGDSELAAQDIRSAIQDLGQIIGYIGVEDLLGEIFSSFCIGK